MKVAWEIVARDIVSPEGPCVDRAGNIFLVSRWTGLVLKVTPEGQVAQVVQTGGKPQAVALLSNGDLLLADAKNRALHRLGPDGQLNMVCDRVGDQPFLGPNDLVIGPGGIVYLTDPGMDMAASGQVLRIDIQQGTATSLVDNLLFPNGITLDNEAAYLYVAESVTHRVWRFSLEAEGRALGQGEVFHQFADFYPDGICFDAAGNLLVALHGAGVLAVLSPVGGRIESIPVGGSGCTNCVFGGDSFQTLYVTEDKQQALLRIRWPVPGQRRFSRSCLV